jgi:hypothetical protein
MRNLLEGEINLPNIPHKFSFVCGLEPCRNLQERIKELHFPGGIPRELQLTANKIKIAERSFINYKMSNEASSNHSAQSFKTPSQSHSPTLRGNTERQLRKSTSQPNQRNRKQLFELRKDNRNQDFW